MEERGVQVPPADPPVDERETYRLSGPDRIATAVEISQFAFPDGADRILLARADVPFDALAGGTVTGGPTLLVPSCGDVAQVVLDEVERLDPDQVYIFGGTQAICDDVLAQVAAA